ncbi:MAG: hypothetical protein ACQER9_01975 [Nanobdellota archaeon]
MERVDYELDPLKNSPYNKNSRFDWSKNIYDPIGGQAILNFKGQFSLEMFYKKMYEWLKEMVYTDIDGGGDKVEHYFFEKRKSDMVEEIWFWWRTQKTPEGNKFLRYRLFIDVQILRMKKDSIVVDGKKFNIDNGEISLFIRPYLDMEHMNKSGKSMIGDKKNWSDYKLLSTFKKYWHNRLYMNQIEAAKNELYTHANQLMGTMKSYLNLPHHVKVRKDFHPSLGVPQYKI